MEQRFFDRKPQGKVELDVCFTCRAIWFDQYESASLTPGAVLELFRLIHKHHDDPPRPLGDKLRCPECRGELVLTQDYQRSTRIAYYRCAAAHGRLTTFFQFMREKRFVRDLARPEIEQLKATVTQVRCSSCGAPVNLGKDPQCGYCRAPVSILDADAVRKTLAELDAAERGRNLPDPQAIVDGLLQGRTAGPKRGHIAGAGSPWNAGAGGAGILDLVGDALEFLTMD